MTAASGASRSVPTVGFEGEEGTPVTELPSWHEHPECRYADGRTLWHGHGFMSAPPPHTHEPRESWGPMVLLPGGDPATDEP